MLQQFLPELGPSLLPEKHYLWFKLANAHPSQWWKKAHWYPFKEKFLAKYAVRDGYDQQVIHHHCWNCDDGSCGQCNDGIYRRVEVALERWLLPTGDVFHRPDRSYCGSVFKNTFEGLLKHGSVSERSALHAALRLWLYHDRSLFLRVVDMEYLSLPKRMVNNLKWKLRNKWIKLYNRVFLTDVL